MSIQEQIFLRYRAEGHVRFEVPDVLCEANRADRLIAALRRIEGIYRVDLYRRQRKLSLRYMDTVVDFTSLVRQLGKALTDLDLRGEAEAGLSPPARSKRWLGGVKNSVFVRWMREKYQEARETVTAFGIVAKRGLAKPPALLKRENTVIQFLNDILVFYLIRTHWHLITQHWVRKPWQYRYEWLSAFYLIFLLVRSRIPKGR